MKKLHQLPILAAIALVILGASSAGADIICVPASLDLDENSTSGEVVIYYDGGGITNVYGYSLDFTWDPSLAAAVFERPGTAPFNGAVTFFVVPIEPGHVRVDAGIGGNSEGITAGDLCKVTFTAVGSALGGSLIDITIEELRDPDNQDVGGVVNAVDGNVNVDMWKPTVENVLFVNNTLTHTNEFVKDGDSITVTAEVRDYDPAFGISNIVADLSGLDGPPTAAPISYSDQVATWTIDPVTCDPITDGLLGVTVTATDPDGYTNNNSGTITADNTLPDALTGVGVAPGFRKLKLVWDDFTGNDTNIKGIEFRYSVWGDHPFYDNGEPAYPGDPTQGFPALTAESGTDTAWTITDRDIYYVAGFVSDMALNYSPAGMDNRGRATNYWLGDLDDSGQVDIIPDINQLGENYGLQDGHDDFDPYCNVGPTDTGHPRGVPQPNVDNEVGFEDMMIFALNWDVVGIDFKAATGGTPVLAWSQVDETTWALSLVEKGGDLQGLNLRAELPDGVDCSVAGGDLLAEQSVPVFLRNMPRAGIDAGLALFGQGAGFSGSGELVRVTLSKPVEEIEISVTARDADNKQLGVELGTGSPDTVPTMARFSQNYPNPFNPHTTLTYELPQERQVLLAIYAVDGTRVRTLVEGMRGAGRHDVSWDGRDDTGRSVAAGTYFARVTAGDFYQIRKMVLVK